MGNTMMKVGLLLLFLGGLLFVGGTVLGIWSYLSDYEEIVIANNSDFREVAEGDDPRYYEYVVTSSEVSRTIRIEISSVDTNQYGVHITVSAELGETLVSRTEDTPISLDVDVSDDPASSFRIEVRFENSSVGMNSVDATVYGDEISGTAAGLCCMSLPLMGAGAVLLILGIIFTVVGAVIGRKKRKGRIRQGPGPYDSLEGPHGYAPYQPHPPSRSAERTAPESRKTPSLRSRQRKPAAGSIGSRYGKVEEPALRTSFEERDHAEGAKPRVAPLPPEGLIYPEDQN
ncbi:MAG: hypothetical protein ACMUHY_05325 [Thermoplasmatota archaeon]